MDIAASILSQVASSMDPMKQAEASIIREHLTSMRVSTQTQKDGLIDKYRSQIKQLREDIKAATTAGSDADAKYISSLETEVDDLYRSIDRVREF